MKRWIKIGFCFVEIILLSLLITGCGKENKDTFLDIKDLQTEEIIRYVIMEDDNGGRYKIYYYGIESAMINVGGVTYDFEQAILSGNITLDEILSDMELYAELNDGGTEFYKDGGSKKYFVDNYSIIRCHTIDGNRDVYIGDSEMEYEEGFCDFRVTDAEIKLQDEINKIKLTNKIIITMSNLHGTKKVITTDEDIRDITDIISRGTEVTLPVNSDGYRWTLSMYDKNNKLISSLYLWNRGYFGFGENKEYYISEEDEVILNNIINSK